MSIRRSLLAASVLLTALALPAAAQQSAVQPDSAAAQIRGVLRAFYMNLESRNWDALAAYVLSPKLLERRGAPGDLQMVVKDRTRARAPSHSTTTTLTSCTSTGSAKVEEAYIRIDGDWADVSVPRCKDGSAGVDQFGMIWFEARWRFIYTDLFEAPPTVAKAPAAPPRAESAPASPDPIPLHDSLSIPSRPLRESRAINVHLPTAYRASRAARFPVLYMPDGGLDEDFPHVVHTVDSLIARGAIRPVIVVGIPNTERRRDLTGPTRIAKDSTIAPRVGGSATFRRFLRDELVPAIEARYRTTGERGIVGESLAGLFVVETFLTDPALFHHYIALDPSLWWNGGALVDSAAGRLAALDSVPRTLFLANSNVEDIAAGTARLASLLRTAAPPRLSWTYEPHAELTHATIFRGVGPSALARALR